MDNQADLLEKNTFNRSKLGLLSVFILTLGIGFFLGNALHQAKPAEIQELKKAETTTDFKEMAVEEDSFKNEVSISSIDSPRDVEKHQFETSQDIID